MAETLLAPVTVLLHTNVFFGLTAVAGIGHHHGIVDGRITLSKLEVATNNIVRVLLAEVPATSCSDIGHRILTHCTCRHEKV